MLAWFGSIALAICSLPLAWAAWKYQYDDTNVGLLVLWTFGEIALAISYYHDPVLMLNYLTNIAGLAVVWYVRWKNK